MRIVLIGPNCCWYPHLSLPPSPSVSGHGHGWQGWLLLSPGLWSLLLGGSDQDRVQAQSQADSPWQGRLQRGISGEILILNINCFNMLNWKLDRFFRKPRIPCWTGLGELCTTNGGAQDWKYLTSSGRVWRRLCRPACTGPVPGRRGAYQRARRTNTPTRGQIKKIQPEVRTRNMTSHWGLRLSLVVVWEGRTRVIRPSLWSISVTRRSSGENLEIMRFKLF